MKVCKKAFVSWSDDKKSGDDIKRDPFEMATRETQGTMFGMAGALAGPVTAYVYDWNMLPIGQQLWPKELKSYLPFPPLQSPESYNLSQIIEQVKQAKHGSPAGGSPRDTSLMSNNGAPRLRAPLFFQLMAQSEARRDT